MLRSVYQIPDLPPPALVESHAVLRAAALAHRNLAELKGRATAIPNPGIVIDTLSLQEARASSEIENIVTTQDDIFSAAAFPDASDAGPAKEVARYRDALRHAWARMGSTQGLLTNSIIIEMFQILKQREDGFRTLPGTALKNALGEVIYVPPQSTEGILAHMKALERFINADANDGLDPITRMAIIHHQFESIHPFFDGNGRIGRILNVLYLAKMGLLHEPILYLSRYINIYKADYYRLLQSVRDDGDWEPWLLFMMRGVSETAAHSLMLINGIAAQMADYKQRIRAQFPRFYSQDLLNNIFRHPYTRIEHLQKELEVSRPTATKYLEALASAGFLQKSVRGKHNYFINTPLVRLFLNADRDAKR